MNIINFQKFLGTIIFGYFGIKYSIYAKDNIENIIVCEVCKCVGRVRETYNI